MKSVHLYKQQISGTPSTSATTWAPINGQYSFSTTENNRKTVIPTGGTLSKIYVQVDTAPGVGKSWVFTLKLNGSDSALTCTLSGTNTSTSDSTHSVSVTAGDLVNISCTPSGTPTSPGIVRIYVEFDSTTAKQSIMGGTTGANAVGSAGPYYVNFTGTFSSPSDTSETTESTLIAATGTIKNLYIDMITAPGAGTSRTVALMLNGVATSLTCSIANTATTGSDTSNSVIVSPGDLISLRVTNTSSPASTVGFKASIVFEATRDGEFNLSTVDPNESATVTFFSAFSSFSNASTSSESNNKGVTSFIIANALYVNLSSAPGVGTSRAYTLRQNSADTGITCTVSDTSTTANDTAHRVTFTATDFIAIKIVPTGTPSVPAVAKFAIAVSVNLLVDVSDSITLTENIIVSNLTCFVSVIDSITISELTNFTGRFTEVSDLLTISESVITAISLVINVSDSITLTEVKTVGSKRYWVSGTGSWSDIAHWSLTSGGSSGAPVPVRGDDVFINSSSGFGSGGTLTIDDGIVFNSFLANSGHSYSIVGDDNWTLTIYGSLTFESGITFDTGLFVEFLDSVTGSSTAKTITTAGVSLGDVSFSGRGGGKWTLQDNLTLSQEFYMENGNFDANNRNIIAYSFSFVSATNFTPIISMGSGTWEASGSSGIMWSLEEQNGVLVTLNISTSTIKLTGNSSSTKYFDGGGKTYYNLWFAPSSGTGTLFLETGSNTFNDIRDTGTAAHSLLFKNGTTTTVNTFTVSGSAGNLITINSDTTATHNFIKSGGGVINSDYLSIQHSVATPSLTWYAGTHSTDNQSTSTAGSGWIFTDSTLSINVSDAITITENIIINNTTNYANVFDAIAITESVVISNAPAGVSASDVITLTENINVEKVYNVNVSDVITITESVAISNSLTGVSIFDSITLTENLNRIDFLNPNVFDVITITESVTVNNTTGFTSVSDAITITESVTISNAPAGVSASDVITLTESVAMLNFFNIFSFDVITLTESITLSNPLPVTGISVFDTIIIDENIQATNSSINVDFITITESVTISNPLPATGINVSDSITLTESVTMNQQFFVNVFDAITVTEGPLYTALASGPNSPGTASDDATVGTLAWNNPDNAKVSDNVYAATTPFSGELETRSTHYLKVTNFGFNFPNTVTILGIFVEVERKGSSITVGDVKDSEVKIIKADGTVGSENKARTSVVWPVSDTYQTYGSSSDLWSETWSYSDINDSDFGVAISASIFSSDSPMSASIDYVRVTVYYYITGYPKVEQTSFTSVSDTITLTENITINNTTGFANVFDAITITENMNVSNALTGISVSDAITITENITINNTTGFANVFDAITITESINVSNALTNISIVDSITITENLSKLEFLDISVSDSITITENIVMAISLPLVVFDVITITEGASSEEILSILVLDGITITENLTILKISFISVADAITITENLTRGTFLDVSVYDLIVITENYSNTGILSVNVVDNITITESKTLEKFNNINVSDIINITESAGMESFRFSPYMPGRILGTLVKAV